MPDTPDTPPCSVQDGAHCDACTLNERINCRWDRCVLNGFIAVCWATYPGTLVLLGIVFLLTGWWWPIAAYTLYVVGIFLFEFRFLCSHCPYYAGEGRVLRCLANNGAPKIWRYNPAPMNGTERSLMLLLVWSLYVVIPLVAGLSAIWLVYAGGEGTVALLATIGVVLLTLAASSTFLWIMKIYYCSRCINFSCPLNTVDKQTVDAYLEKNPVMREAWEGSGYSLTRK
ncbi:hypothetical protein [Methanofollis fontis]|uniref:Uncharacterized protein n=1 Tax=Methanofollis fontis TaxID=2052832 RepID=A0A483CVJ8_9EURY|nr:hypothetical protein [Methanofollis fontis]TAJ45686.1 hypothetical protein CUJ86_02935 [Methanofollis fontis]